MVTMMAERWRRLEALTREQYAVSPITDDTNQAKYSAMVADAGVRADLDTLKSAILGEEWTIVPGDDSSAARIIAQDTTLQCQDFDLDGRLWDALECVARGFSAHELTWKLIARHYVLQEPALLDPETFALDLDEHMRIQAYLGSHGVGSTRQRLHPQKVWFATNQGNRLRPCGVAFLDVAARPYNAKDNLLKFWGVALQRHGQPFFVAKVGNKTTAQLEAIRDAFFDLRLDGVALIPNDVEYDVHNPAQWANVSFESALVYHDAQISRAILLQRGAVGQASAQSYVTGEGLAELARATAFRLNRVSRDLRNSFRQQVLAPLTRANYGDNPGLVPKLVLPRPDVARIVELAAPLVQLIGAGVLDAEGAADIVGIPEGYNVPGTTALSPAKPARGDR